MRCSRGTCTGLLKVITDGTCCVICGAYYPNEAEVEMVLPKKEFHTRANYGMCFPEKLERAEGIIEPHYEGILKLREQGETWKRVSVILRKLTGSIFRESTMVTCINKITEKRRERNE